MPHSILAWQVGGWIVPARHLSYARQGQGGAGRRGGNMKGMKTLLLAICNISEPKDKISGWEDRKKSIKNVYNSQRVDFTRTSKNDSQKADHKNLERYKEVVDPDGRELPMLEIGVRDRGAPPPILWHSVGALLPLLHDSCILDRQVEGWKGWIVLSAHHSQS
jgi:hypothetical protein